MGSKNRIYLGILTGLILHKMRNIFQKNELYITKQKKNKIKHKHPEEYKLLIHHHFQQVLDNTVATCEYSLEDNLYNFLSWSVDQEKYLLYSISTNNHNLELGTIFFASKKQLRKCKRENNLAFLNREFEEAFERYINC